MVLLTRMRRVLALVTGVFVVGLAAPAEAQVCHGHLPFGSDRHVDLDAGASTSQGPTLRSGRSGIVSVDFGTGDSFVRASVQRNRYSDYGYTTTEVDASVGKTIEVLPRSKLVLCPEAELWVEHAATLGPGPAMNVSSLSRTLAASLRVGSLHSIRGVPVAGFVGTGVFVGRNMLFAGAPGIGSDTETSNQFGGFAEIGAGCAAFGVLDVAITYRIPVGLKFGLTSTTLLVGIAF